MEKLKAKIQSSPWILNVTLLFSSCFGAEVCAQTIEEYARQGEQLLRNYQLREATELLQMGLERHPDEPVLLRQLGSLLVYSGRPAQGEWLLQKALAIQPHNAEIHRAIAEAHLRQRKLSSAIALFQNSLKENSEDGALNHDLAFALFLKNEPDGALERARRSVELNPLDPAYRRFYALLLDVKGRREESYQQLKIAQQLAPRDAYLWFQLSEKQRLAGKVNQALESLRMASELDPENPLYHTELSHIYDTLGQKATAIQEADQARGLYQAFEVYVQALGLVEKGRRVEAARMLEPAVENHPEFITGMMLLADLNQKMGQEARALDLYLKVLQRDPLQVAAREQAAWMQVQQGALDSALGLLGKSLRPSPNQVLVEGYRQQDQKNYAEALRHYRSIECDNPLNPGLLQLIGFCLNALGQKEEALQYLTKAEKLWPGHPDIQRQAREIGTGIKFENAMKLFQRNNWKAALQVFSELIEQGEAQASYCLYTAYCRQRLGDLAGAVKDYQAGLRLDPEATWAQKNLAVTLYLLSRYEEAARQWERILARAKTSEEYFQLGLCYIHLNRPQAAEEAFHAAWARGKETPELLYHLGVTRLRNGKLSDAWQLIRRSARGGYGPAEILLKQARTKGIENVDSRSRIELTVGLGNQPLQTETRLRR